jgi:hypothetical protein
MKLKKGGNTMRKKWIIFCIILMVVGTIIVNRPHKPRLISNITTLDTSYMTILVDRSEAKDVKKLEERLVQMCREDAFENIKLGTKDRPMVKRWVISVFLSKADLEKGKPYLTIKKDAGN